jgi:hypothetical protein
MKLLFDSLDAFLVEIRDQKVEIVRISPALGPADRGDPGPGEPRAGDGCAQRVPLGGVAALGRPGHRGGRRPRAASAGVAPGEAGTIRSGRVGFITRDGARARPGRDRHPFRNSGGRRPRAAQTSRGATMQPAHARRGQTHGGLRQTRRQASVPCRRGGRWPPIRAPF